MRTQLSKSCLLLAIALCALLALPAGAQMGELAHHTESYTWSSGVFDGPQDPFAKGLGAELAANELVSVPGSTWVQLEFHSVRLGAGSYLQITSLLDGATQRLDAETVRQWGYRSAYFNGDMVEVELYVAPFDREIFVNIEKVVVGDWQSQDKSICGSDDRVSANDARVGRIVPIGCTGWLVDNGKMITAGHCLNSTRSQILEFNVPDSNPDGSLNHPGPEDQYPIDQSSFTFADGGVGNDWGTFAAFANSTTGLTAFEAQGSAFAIKQDLGPANIRITGFGVDSGVDNQSHQTHVGPNVGSSGTTMRYTADTTGGNSGSPVIDEATNTAVGVHTHGGCSSTSGNNHGTSFFNNSFWQAVTGQAPSCAPKGDACTVDADCCSNKCKGPSGRKSCK